MKDGPFEAWQAAGWKQVGQWIAQDVAEGATLANVPLPPWVLEGPVAERGGPHQAEGSWSPAKQAFVAPRELPVYAKQLFRQSVRGAGAPDPHAAGHTVHEDDSMRLWTLEGRGVDDVLIASIKTKVHAIGPGVGAGLLKAVELAESRYRGLVIWSPDEPFSVGADLQAMLPLFMSGGVKAISAEEKKLQDALMRLKYAQVPSVAAISGMALGGGCEVALHCTRRVANLESYIGLVEVGVGLIPGGGGLKEGALRGAIAAQAAGMTDMFPFIRNWFTNAAMAKVSTSALEARAMGYLLPTDTVVFNRYELLWTAIGEAFALHATGYRPPLATKGFPVAGRTGLATIRAQLANMRDGGFISAHDYFIAGCIADVMCGGDVEAGSLVDEQWLLDLERKYFGQLLAHPKSQERMMGMMQTGKPVRN
jgi:3-hydroxyacyl-CoA dehydrogenase